MATEIKKKITRNTIANYIGYSIRTVVNFFLFPFVVHRLGVTEAGIWFLLSSVTGYLGLLDLGIKPALVKHIAQYNAKGDKKSISQIVSIAFLIFLVMGAVAGVIMLIIGFLLPQFFRIDPEIISQARTSAYIVAGALFLSFPLSAIGGGVLNGLQRYDKTRTAGIFSSLSGAAAIVFLLSQGYGLVAVVLADQITNFLGWLLNVYFAKRLAPYLKIQFRNIKKEFVWKVFKFSGLIFIIKFASQIIYYTDKIVIGIFLNVGAIVFYEAAYKIHKVVTRIPMLLVSAMMPASSELDAQKKPETLKKLYLYSTKYMTAFFLFLVIPVLIFTKPILNLWIGPEFESSAIYARLFLLVTFFVLNHTAGMQILIGTGKIKSITRYQVIVAVFNLALSIVLVKTIGLIGVVLGTVIPFIVMEWFYIKIAFKTLGVKWQEYIPKVLIKAYIPGLISAAVLLILNHYFHPVRVHEIILVIGINFIIYGSLFYFFGLGKFEKDQFKSLLKKEGKT